jgi:hypothetical protein
MGVALQALSVSPDLGNRVRAGEWLIARSCSVVGRLSIA